MDKLGLGRPHYSGRLGLGLKNVFLKLKFKIGPSLIKYSLALRYARYFRFLCQNSPITTTPMASTAHA